jgi:TPR repeat protein
LNSRTFLILLAVALMAAALYARSSLLDVSPPDSSDPGDGAVVVESDDDDKSRDLAELEQPADRSDAPVQEPPPTRGEGKAAGAIEDRIAAIVERLRPYTAVQDYGGVVSELEQAYSEGEAAAALMLGRVYASDDAGMADPSLAETWYLRAEEGGVTAARGPLVGLWLQRGDDPAPYDPDRALEMLRSMVDDGDGVAGLVLIDLYAVGLSAHERPLEPARAVELARMLARTSTDPRVLHAVAQRLQWGIDGEPRPDLAVDVYVDAGDHGDEFGYNNAAWLMATCADGRISGRYLAVELARRALEAYGEKPSVMDTLAAAYAANGQFDQAIEAQRDAIELIQSGAFPGPVPQSFMDRLTLYGSDRDALTLEACFDDPPPGYPQPDG